MSHSSASPEFSRENRPSTRPQVFTFVTPMERQRLDMAGLGCYHSVHHESLDEVIDGLRTTPASAIIVSASCYQHHRHAPSVARLVREFPRVQAVALLTANESRSTQALLSLGEHGVRTLIDAREPSGWRRLRALVNPDEPDDIERLAIRTIRDDLTDACATSIRFFDSLFTAPRTLTTVRELARSSGVMPTTFMSRFFRAGIPAPKRYLAHARLVRAARLLENPGYSITQVAFLLDYSSPQSFSRHVTGILEIGAAEFRRRHTGESMLEDMRRKLILPYREQLRDFDPYASPPPWLARKTRRIEGERTIRGRGR